jgi:hypothetical protein
MLSIILLGWLAAALPFAVFVAKLITTLWK